MGAKAARDIARVTLMGYCASYRPYHHHQRL